MEEIRHRIVEPNRNERAIALPKDKRFRKDSSSSAGVLNDSIWSKRKV